MKIINKNILYIYLGAFIEAFDFCIYLVFSKQLASFLMGNESLFASTMLFSISYLARPIGSYYFGLKTKKDANNLNLFLRNSPLWIAIPTIIIAFCPNNSLGLYVLLFCRFIQGFIFGGESGLSFVYAYLNTNKFKVTTVSAFLTSGAVAMSLCFMLIPLIPSIYEIESWRVAFLLSGILSLIFIYIRNNIPKINNIKITNNIDVNILRSISYIIIYSFIFNIVIAFLTSGQKIISISSAMIILSVLSIFFGLIIDKFKIYNSLYKFNIVCVSIIALSFFLKNNYLIFITSYISCCILGGISISASINYLSNNKNLYPYFGLTYNVVMGCLGSLVPLFKELFI